MTREEFIKVLGDYPYEIEGNKIIVTDGSPPTSRRTGSPTVFLNDLTSIPSDVEFRNKGAVRCLFGIPPNLYSSHQYVWWKRGVS